MHEIFPVQLYPMIHQKIIENVIWTQQGARITIVPSNMVLIQILYQYKHIGASRYQKYIGLKPNNCYSSFTFFDDPLRNAVQSKI